MASAGERRGRRKLFSCYLDEDALEALRGASRASRIPMSELIRDGVALVLGMRVGPGWRKPADEDEDLG